MKCQNCSYEWRYTGKSDYYTSCPRCLYRVKVKTDLKRKLRNLAGIN